MWALELYTKSWISDYVLHSLVVRLQRPPRVLADVQKRLLLAERRGVSRCAFHSTLPGDANVSYRMVLDEPVPGYHRLWDMLIKRCHNLEHLAIDGHSPHAPVDAHGLLRGRWPKLRSLLIGDVVLDWHVGLNPARGRPFRIFLDAHRNLEALHLQSHAPSVAAPGILADLHADALAKVSTFSGALAQAQVLPARASLKTLRVPEALPLREGTSLTVSSSLTMLPALASLTIAFRLEQGYENGSILRTVIAACPHLRHLDFTVACRPSFTIVSQKKKRSIVSLPLINHM
jgi:hypothetical protein